MVWLTSINSCPTAQPSSTSQRPSAADGDAPTHATRARDVCSLAGLTESAKLNFHGSSRPCWFYHDGILRKTLDIAALATNEMRVVGVGHAVGTIGRASLEAPKMVAKINAAKKSASSQIHQVAIERCRIESMTLQSLADFSVGKGSFCIGETGQCNRTCIGGSHARLSEAFFEAPFLLSRDAHLLNVTRLH